MRAAGIMQAANPVRDKGEKRGEFGAVFAALPDFGKSILHADGVREVERDEGAVAQPRALPPFQARHRLDCADVMPSHVAGREERA